MLVKQLSVFMENRPGRLYKLTHALGKEGIDFVTLSIADTKDCGIVRFIARDNERAYEILKKEGFTVGQTELIGVEVDDKPNALAEVVALMEEANMTQLVRPQPLVIQPKFGPGCTAMAMRSYSS